MKQTNEVSFHSPADLNQPETYDGLFQNDHVIMLIIDPQSGQIMDANPAAEHFYGWNLAELRRINIKEINTLTPGEVQAEMERARAASKNYFVFKHHRADGSIRAVEVYSGRVAWRGQAMLYSIVHDITERALLEEARRQSEEKYRSLVEASDAIIITVDAAGCIHYANDKASRQGAIPAANLIGKNLSEIFSQNFTDIVLGWVRKVIETNQGIVTETSIGDQVYFRNSIQPIRDQSGQAVMALISTTDITELKLAQRELLELNRSLEERVRERTAEVQERTAEVQDLYENAPTGYHSLDAEGHFIRLNATELKWLGYTRSELIGKSFASILTPESAAQFAKTFPEFKANGQVRDLELDLICKDGSILPVNINATAIYDAEGQFVASRSTMIDNTEHKQAEAARRLASLEMERAMRMKDEFLASMSHELRTPLTGILGLSEALQLQTYGGLNEKQVKSLKNIEISGRHLLDLINDILDLSKIEAGKLEMQFELCSLGEICQASLQMIKGMAQKKRVKISFAMDAIAVHVRAEPRRLKQMLVNLLSNAVKFTLEGGSVGLDVDSSRADSMVGITVWDTGIGITPEDLGRLFQPFVQLDSSLARQHSGSGLGLSLVQRMVALHNGQIEVQSKPGEGSRFTILLPHAPQLEDAEPELDRMRPASGTDFALHRVLLIEDQPLNIERIQRYCEALGLSVVVQKQGSQAVASALAQKPGVIFLDIDLLDRSGWQILAELKAHPETAHIPVIIASVTENRIQAADLGATGYLVKPFTFAELRAVLNLAMMTLRKEATAIANSWQTAPLVMVVDDQEINIETIAEFLEAQRFRVATAFNGIDFLEQFPCLHPDIILMDIQMPGTDGFEVIRRVRASPDAQLAATPVIAVTALAMPGDRERCLQAGANEYLSKPISLQQTVQLIRAMLKPI